MKLTIQDGRDSFYTFDSNRILLLTATDEEQINQVEFSTEEAGGTETWTKDVLEQEDGVKYVQVPNEFLNGDYTRLVCYAVALDSKGEFTRQKEVFRIKYRPQPEDWFLTYSERVTFASIKALTEQYKSNASDSAELASKYAENNEDVAVESGKYSAKHWSIKSNKKYEEIRSYVGSASDPESALGSIESARAKAVSDLEKQETDSIESVGTYTSNTAIPSVSQYVEGTAKPALKTYGEQQVDSYVNGTVKPELDRYVNNEKKQVLDEYTAEKKTELDTYTSVDKKKVLDDYVNNVKKVELNTYTNDKKSELDVYKTTKADELNEHTVSLKGSLDGYTTAKEQDILEFTEQKKQEVQGVYQTDLNELKGDISYYHKDYKPYINVINASVGSKRYKLLLAGNTYVVTNKSEATLSISTETTDDTTSETIESFGQVVSNMSKEITPTQDGYLGVYANRTNTFTVECVNDIYYKFTKNIKDIKDILEKCVKGGINITSTSVLDNADNAELNMMYFTSVRIENTPEEYGTLITIGPDVNYCIQLFASNKTVSSNSLYYRIKWVKWGEWVKVNGNVTTNEYFDFSLVRKFGVVGDSYASGEVYWKNSDNTYSSKDKYSISWGQILARKHGNICTNYSAGGLSTRTWLTNPNGLQKMLSSEPEDIYLLALGINDYYNIGESYLGTISDITSHSSYSDYGDTFYGNYGKIIERIKEHAPNSKLIMFTVASNDTIPAKFNTAIENIANHYNIPCIKQLDDTFFTSTVYTNMVQGHPRALGYVGMASAFDRLITKCVNKNYNYFASMFMNADD